MKTRGNGARNAKKMDIEWIILSFNYVDGAWPKRLDGVVRRESFFVLWVRERDVTTRRATTTTTTTTTTTMAMATATATRSTATMARTTRAMAATARAGRGARASGARAMKMPMKMTTTTTTTRAVREDDEDASSEPEIVEPSAMREPTTTTTTPDATSEVIRVETRAEGEYELRRTTTPKRFAVADGELLNVATAAAPIALRWTSGLMCHGYEAKVVDGEVGEGEYAVWSGSGKAVRETSDVAKFPRPEKPLKMYQFQGCPFCKKVREAVISLDLDVIYYPCPRDGPEYREFVRAEGGRAQFPYLVDDNTGTKMYESDDIIAYMYEKYGPGKANIGPALTSGMLTSVTAGLALLPRLGKGSAYAPSKKPENMQPIVFYGYEGSPFCVLVAEKLCELELPYLQRSCGRGSPKRQELFDKRGTFQVPYIEDPNTGIAMFESKDIVNYLQEQYAA